jgi:hypothetical protein
MRRVKGTPRVSKEHAVPVGAYNDRLFNVPSPDTDR